MRLCVFMIAWASLTSQQFAHAQFRASSDFESGSAKILKIDPQRQEISISPAGKIERGMPNWWFLRLDDVNPDKPVTLEVVALDAQVPGEGVNEGKTAALNVGWTLPACAAISTDGTTWTQSEPTQRDGNRAVYTVRTKSKTVWLAWGPPFTGADAVAWVKKMEKEHSFAKAFTLAKSREGRSVPGIEISEGDKPAAQRPAVFVTARQHAWECGGSWVGVGFVEWAASDDEQAKWLRQNTQIIFIPVMDVDHVATGDGGKHARPQDHNRDWSDQPHWPEVAAAQERIRAIAKENRLAVFLDLHNPSPGAKTQNFYVQYPPYVGSRAAELQERFLKLVKDEIPDLRLTDGKPKNAADLPVWKRISTPWASEHGNPQTISFTVETPWNIPAGTVEGYRAVGEKLGRIIERYLREVKP